MTSTDEPTPLAEVLALELAAARHRTGLSARALAQKCSELGIAGVDRQRIANIEAGRGRPVGVVELLALAYILRAFPTEILRGVAPATRNALEDARWQAWATSWIALGDGVAVERGGVDGWMTGEWPAWGEEDDAEKFLPRTPEPDPQRPPTALEREMVAEFLQKFAAQHELEVTIQPSPKKGGARGKR